MLVGNGPLPRGDIVFELKNDGWRCTVGVDGPARRLRLETRTATEGSSRIRVLNRRSLHVANVRSTRVELSLPLRTLPLGHRERRAQMGQGTSSRGAGTGLGGAGIADGALAINCRLQGIVAALPHGSSGSGDLRRAGRDVIVVDSSGARIASCDPADPLTPQLHACLGQSFAYTARVTAASTGATSIDVAPAS